MTTIGNLAWTVACAIGSAMTMIWDVSNDTLASGNFDGLLKLTILTSFLQIVPLCLVFLLPDSKDELVKLRDAGVTNVFAGSCLAIVIILALISVVSISVFGLLQ